VSGSPGRSVARPVLATRNAHKVRELARMGLPCDPLPDHVELPAETGDSFASNALLKARAASAATGRPAVADDSGIGAQSLGWAPGIHSARYAGEGATDAENLEKLRAAVEPGSPLRYTCALVYVDGGGEHVFLGRCTGTMGTAARGERGFGYDPVFCPEEHPGRTMAELDDAAKDAISHRGRAVRALAAWLRAGVSAG
jgi:XTP/dITP diphosphohydrolase